MPSALLSPSVDVCRWICDFVLEDYRGRGRYTDCLLLCGRDQNAALKCHSLVLATISPWLGHLIRDQEERILHFFDLSTTELKVFLDEVYHGFSSSVAEVKIEVSENVSQALGMKLALKDLEYNCDSSFLADAAMKTEEPLAQKEEEESDADREEVVAATHEQSQPVKRKRGRPSIPYFDNEIRSKKLKIDASSNAMGDGSSDLDGMMRLGEGTLPEVPVIFQDWAAQRVLPFLQPKSYFRAIFGILGETSCCVHVTPLAWSDPSEVDIPTQFKRTISAYKAVFGFSQAEMTNNSILCHKQNIITGNFRKRKLDEVFKTFCQKDSADIQAGLERHNDLISTFEVTTDPAASNTPGLNSELVNLKLVNSSLADPPFIGVIVVAWRKSGVRCFPMVLNLEDRANASDLCLKALFDVWCTSEKKLPVTDYLKTVYEVN